MKILLVLTSLLISVTTFAAAESCDFELACNVEGKKFSVAFQSKTHECSEDDMEITLKGLGASKKLDLPADWYFYTDHISKTQSSVCKDSHQVNSFAAYEIDKNKVLFFTKVSGRPGYDRVMAFLLDLKSGKVLDSKSLGTTRNQYVAVLKTADGFKTRIVRESLSFHKDVTCDCDAPFVDDWMGVSVIDGKIKSDWL